MSKLSNIRKQIAALEAQAARIAKGEMESAIGKVKSLMADFGLTIEHLAQSVAGKTAAKKAKATPKKAAVKKAASSPKYADPKSGKTWSGFGRAPGWIAGAKSRDAFLVNKGAALTGSAKKAVVTKVAVTPAKKAVKTVAKTTKRVANKAEPIAKRVAASAKKATATVTMATPKKVAVTKKGSKRSVAKRTSAPSQSPATSAPNLASE